MKTRSKVLLLTLCAVALVVGSVMGTLAFLTDRQTVTNTFTVGNVDITVDEEKVDPDGTPTEEDDERVTENDYHLIPGQTYVKDPTVTVEAGSEESYVRMMVTINCVSELKAIFGDNFLPENYVEGWDSSVWSCVAVTEDANANTATYEFRYHTTVDAYEATEDIVLEPLFTSLTVPGEVTGEQLATLDTFEIAVEGHAIQTATFTNADAAWEAFEIQYNAQG